MKPLLSTMMPILSLINGQSMNDYEMHARDTSACIQPYQQCGGKIAGNLPYQGQTCCTHGYICTVVSEYWSQCDPDTRNISPTNQPSISSTTTTTHSISWWEWLFIILTVITFTIVSAWGLYKLYYWYQRIDYIHPGNRG